MRSAIEISKYFIKNDPNSFKNTFDGNMKLQKLLTFAQLIFMSQNEYPLFNDPIYAFENGCVVENVRHQYKDHYQTLIGESSELTIDFTEEELSALDNTIRLFGSMTAKQLSEYNHQFDFWKNAYSRSIGEDNWKDTDKSFVTQQELESVAQNFKVVVDALNVPNSLSEEVINGISFFYDPEELELTLEIYSELLDFSLEADDLAYTVYKDDEELVIY